MKIQHANKLHNEDEVIVKKTGEVMKVLDIQKGFTLTNGRTVTLVQMVSKIGGFMSLPHTEIK